MSIVVNEVFEKCLADTKDCSPFKDGKYLVMVGSGYVQTESGPFIPDLGAIGNRAMTGAQAGGAAVLVK